MSRVLFQPAAAAELDEAYRWYERERAGLGDEFLQAAQALIARVAENPLAFPLVHRDKRRAVFRRFPYSLIYRRSRGGRVRTCVLPGQAEPEVVALSSMRANNALNLTKGAWRAPMTSSTGAVVLRHPSQVNAVLDGR